MQAHGLNCIRLPHLCSSEEIPKFQDLRQPSPVCGHVGAHRNVCQSGNRWGPIRRPDWDAGVAWTWGVRGDEAQHTAPRGSALAPPISTESSYSHLCLDAPSDGEPVRYTLSKIDPNTYPGHLRNFGSRFVVKLPIRRESSGVERSWEKLRGILDWHPAKVKWLIFLENVANSQFPRIPVFNTDSHLWDALKLLKFCFSICQHYVANRFGVCGPDLHWIPEVFHGMLQSPLQNPSTASFLIWYHLSRK